MFRNTIGTQNRQLIEKMVADRVAEEARIAAEQAKPEATAVAQAKRLTTRKARTGIVKQHNKVLEARRVVQAAQHNTDIVARALRAIPR